MDTGYTKKKDGSIHPSSSVAFSSYIIISMRLFLPQLLRELYEVRSSRIPYLATMKRDPSNSLSVYKICDDATCSHKITPNSMDNSNSKSADDLYALY